MELPDALAIISLDSIKLDITSHYPEPTQTLPHVNPWNFTAKMMILKPRSLYNIVRKTFDVIHVVLPLNLRRMWILAAFMVKRTLLHDCKPALVVSWHVNLTDYMNCHAPFIVNFFPNIHKGIYVGSYHRLVIVC